MAHRTRNHRSGVGYIEVLVSMLILTLSILAALSLYGFSMNLITRTGDQGQAYNLARKSIENARQLGFGVDPVTNILPLPDGTTTVYWDSKSTTSSGSVVPTSYFKVVQAVSTDKTQTGTGYPAPDATRTVTVTVSYSKTGEQILQTGTLLVRSGV